MANMAKEFVEFMVGMIVIQVVAVVIAGLQNFSATGLLIAGFIDVIMIAVLVAKLAKKI